MDFSATLTSLKSGSKARRQIWDDGCFILISGDAIVLDTGDEWEPDDGDLLASDWELVT